jgi:hypothetical protein
MTALSTKLPPIAPCGESSAGSQLPQATGTALLINPPPAEPFSPASFDVESIHDSQENPDDAIAAAMTSGATRRPDSPPAVAMEVSAPTVAARRLADAILLLRAEALSDLEATRIANENRLRSLRQDYGLSEGPEIAAQTGLVQAIAELEHRAELELKRALRKHPLGAWVKTTQGVGEKQGARLIAAIGDPYWHSVHDRPRLVSELWAYSGLHVLHPGQRTAGDQMKHARVQSDLHPGHPTSETPVKPAGMEQTTVGNAGTDAHIRPADGSPGRTTNDDHALRAGAQTSVGHNFVDPHTDHADGQNSAGQRGADAHTAHAGGPSDAIGLTCTEAHRPDAGGVAPRRQRGQKANWNGAVKTRAYLVAESCIKKRDSPYRPVYDTGRAKYTDALHNHPCVRCGPAGKPAQPGSPLSLGHQHARAMRLVMKAILLDLWLESKRLHEGALWAEWNRLHEGEL